MPYCRVAQLYSQLSTHAHPHQVSIDKLDIVEGPVSVEQMLLVACLCKEAELPYELYYRPKLQQQQQQPPYSEEEE